MCKQSTLSACHVGKGAGLGWVADGSSMLCLWSAVPRIAVSFGGMHFNRGHSSCGNLFDLLSEVVISRPQIHRAQQLVTHRTDNFGATYDGGDPLDIIGPYWTYWTQTPRCRQIASPWSSACSRQPRRQGSDGLRWAQQTFPDTFQKPWCGHMWT